MAEQFFFDADGNNSDNNNLDLSTTNQPNSGAPTFSQFNKWTLVDESDVEDEADTDFLEHCTQEGLDNILNSSQVEFRLDNKPFDETLVDVDEDNNADPTHQTFDDEYESEAIISKEAMQRHADTNRSVQTGTTFLGKKKKI